VAALLLAACSTPPAAAVPTVAPTAVPAAKPTTAPAPAASPAAAASPSPSEGGQTLTLGGTTFQDHGTTDVKSMADLTIEAEDNYFEPTFLQGAAGQKIKLTIKNTGARNHNLTITSQNIDMDVAPGATITADVTFPSSGALLYFCKFHARGGMNGELLVGTATPQPVSTAGTSTTNAPNQSTTSGYGY
jgi:plastocyanin